VKGVNKANAYANELFPRLKEAFAPFVGKPIKTKAGAATAKVSAMVEKLNLPNNNGLQVYKHLTDYYAYFYVKTCVTYEGIDGGYGCFYYEVGVPIGPVDHGILTALESRPFSCKADYKASDIEAARVKFKEAEKLADEAKSALHPFGEFDR
jgi:hypothetical protein